MTSYGRSALVTVGLLLLTLSASSAEKTLDNHIRQAIANKYPGEQVAAWCGGGFLGKPRDAAIALNNPAQKQFRVVWARANGRLQELQSMAAFGNESAIDLKCLNAQQARQLKQTLRHSEAIRDFLRAPAGQGMLCYFVDQTETKCWSVDGMGNLFDAGGWQT